MTTLGTQLGSGAKTFKRYKFNGLLVNIAGNAITSSF
jgi:hypothetical protein